MIIREIFEILQEEDLLSWHPVFKWINEKKKKSNNNNEKYRTTVTIKT